MPGGVRMRIEPATVKVILHGGESFLKNLQPEKISASIRYRNEWKKHDTFQLPVQITSPGNLVYCEAIPGLLNVSIE